MKNNALDPVGAVKDTKPEPEPETPEAAGTVATQPARPADLLNEKQIRAITELAKGISVTEVAEKIGVNRSTIHRWLRDRVFISERNLIMEEMREQVRNEALSLAKEALQTAQNVMECGFPARDMLAAAKLILRINGLDQPTK